MAPDRRQALRAALPIGLVLLAAVALRGMILATGQKYLRSDEAAVGLMARHILTRGERPLFLYGQPYGGGHAMTAYLAAPLFALFGPSGALLTAVPAFLSLISIFLVWAIVRRYMSESAALPAAILYAFSPPVVYQAVLVNGGTESFLLALAALWFFLRAYSNPGDRRWSELAAGTFAGLGYYAMDYALLYAVVFALLWALRRNRSAVARFGLGFLIGAAPLIYFNFQNDFQHLRLMFAPSSGPTSGIVPHFVGAMWGLVAGNLASFYGGEIDDFRKASPGAWAHAALALVSVVALAIRYRGALRDFWRRADRRATAPRVQAAAIPLVFIAVYLGMYGVAKFSLPGLRTPRYLLPLCPFLSMAIAHALTSFNPAWLKRMGLAAIGLVALHGAVLAGEIGSRPWHYEHRIATSGPQTRELADQLLGRNVRFAYAPYEIQWRLMFDTNESLLVSCSNVSSVTRYPRYERSVKEAVFGKGEPCAFVFRRDFAFAELASNSGMGVITRERWMRACRAAGIPEEGVPVGSEFVYYYPLDTRFIRVLERVIRESIRSG